MDGQKWEVIKRAMNNIHEIWDERISHPYEKRIYREIERNNLIDSLTASIDFLFPLYRDNDPDLFRGSIRDERDQKLAGN